MNQQVDNKRVERRLRILQWSAWIDLILLVALLASAFSKQRNLVQILGPLHGINFLLLIAIATTAALDGLWSWWFPVAILFTAGAPGALIGERIIKQRIKAQAIDHHDGSVSSSNRIEAENAISASDTPSTFSK